MILSGHFRNNYMSLRLHFYLGISSMLFTLTFVLRGWLFEHMEAIWALLSFCQCCTSNRSVCYSEKKTAASIVFFIPQKYSISPMAWVIRRRYSWPFAKRSSFIVNRKQNVCWFEGGADVSYNHTRGHSESADLRQGSSSVSTYCCYTWKFCSLTSEC